MSKKAIHPMTFMKIQTMRGRLRREVYALLAEAPRKTVHLSDGRSYPYVVVNASELV